MHQFCYSAKSNQQINILTTSDISKRYFSHRYLCKNATTVRPESQNADIQECTSQMEGQSGKAVRTGEKSWSSLDQYSVL